MAKIMLVEDDPTMVSLLKTLLEIEGHQVQLLDGIGQENVADRICRFNPDILLMDIYLRKMNGLELLRSLRADARLSGLRVIMTSGADLSIESAQAGADAFLPKPFMPSDLFAMIEKVTP